MPHETVSCPACDHDGCLRRPWRNRAIQPRFSGSIGRGGTFSSITVLPRQASDTTAPPASIEQLPPRRGRTKPKGSRHNRTCRRRSGCYLLRRGLYLPHELTSLIGKEVTYEGL